MVALQTPVCNFDEPFVPFSLPATSGETLSFEDIKGENGTLVMFICNHCPYVKAIVERLVSDVKALQDKGIGVVAICSNDPVAYPADSFEKMQEFAHENGFTFPYLQDESQQVAKAYGAVCTPDFFGYNADGGLQYRGRLDASRKEPVEDAKRELLEAMTQVAETGQGPQEQHPSMGCNIKWKEAA